MAAILKSDVACLKSVFRHCLRRYSRRYICRSNIKMSQRLSLSNGEYLEYHHSAGDSPGIVFIPGLMSSMNGTKAIALERFCRSTNRAYTRFDHRGMGLSSGKTGEFTIGSRKEDVLSILRIITGPQILVGSSLGGWIMLLVAMEIPHRIQGLVGIATATDFFKRRFESLPEETKIMIEATGKWELPTPYNEKPYVLSWDLIQEGRNHELGESIPINCPVRLLHGMDDKEVPFDISVELAKHLQSDDVNVTLIKDGSHRLSQPKHIQAIIKTIEQLIQEMNVNQAVQSNI